MAAKRKQEDEEKRTRARRMEARLQKEEAARLKREHAREHRRKEREAREQSTKAVTSTSVNFLWPPLTVPCSRLSSPERQPEDARSSTSHRSTDYPRDHKIEGELSLSRSSTRTPVGDWELCCEICHRQGVNIVCQCVTLFYASS